ncbi:MAG TPA: UvrD-helicase domain-containing protein [Opitutaceae bacterium]|nr:UvrD-helicase domain-containing protein [Opitutaceae bacterium]
MTAPRHTMILASAGSGKTYALTNRFVALLAHGAAPERIVALTFTRKAAGEFFDEILNKLAKAAVDERAADRLARAIEAPALTTADFLRMLRAVVDAMPRLSLGTLDGFFARIVRTFPLELGLSGEFEILQEHAARQQRRRVLRTLFTAAGEPDEQQREFIEAFKRATFGVEEKQLSRRLDAYLDSHAEIFLAAPDAGVWGQSQRIWPSGHPWTAADRAALADAENRQPLPWATLTLEQQARINAFFEQLSEWSAGAPLPKDVEYVLKNAFKVWDNLLVGRADLTLERRKVSLSPEACRALVTLVRGVVGAELERRLEMTRGLYSVLRGYERIYHEAVRRGGRLTFADIQRLLLPDSGTPFFRSAGNDLDSEDVRLAIDWRLDAKFDHWLLDEFQDTSYGQWSVLRNLVDEAVQDPEGRRSLFYVGDVKQAIFSWREGDPRLFREIFEHYNQAGEPVIEERQLNQSWRSGPAVIRMVNLVFGDTQALRQIVPESTAATWTREWRAHTTAHPDLDGFASLTTVVDEDARFAETLRILQLTTPLERGLSVAILVQKNDTGARLADYLRRVGGLKAVAESDLAVCTDNPLGVGLLALLRAAAYPGDTQAWGHVKMSPLAPILAREGITRSEELTPAVLARVQAEGIAGAMEPWIQKVERGFAADDAFSRLRARQWLEAAHLFDESGRRDIGEFLDYAERHTVREADTAAVVRVLTVHKSKGLGFDLVILPDLEGKSLAERRRGLAVKKANDRSVEWVLDPPATLFSEKDDVLSAYLNAASDDAAYEALCRLYVAMTRAKRAMYLIVENVGDSTSRNFPQLLRAVLGETFSEGNPNWFLGVQAPPESSKRVVDLEPVTITEAEADSGRGARLVARTPSGTERTTLAASALFSLEGRDRASYGTAVHAHFAQISFLENSDLPDWLSRPQEDDDEDQMIGLVQKDVRNCFNARDLSAVFMRPFATGRVELWRERAFEIVLDGLWITGVFDRVVVERDPRGQVVRASVWDFKTDRVASLDDANQVGARYRAQLALYRRVAARLTGLQEKEVAAALVFTQIRQLVPWEAISA